jgi:hypothetical protein
MARIEQLDLLNEVVISHDDDDDGKLWFTIFTVLRQCDKTFTPPKDKRVEWRIHCTFDEAKQVYGIVIGTLLQQLRQPGVMPKEQWKDVFICLCRGKIKDGCCVREDSVGGCELLDVRNIFNQHLQLELVTPAFDPWGENELDELEDE